MSGTLLRIKQMDSGRGALVYETRNSEGERIYYCLMKTFPKTIEFYRCSQPFTEYGEVLYEPQDRATPKAKIKIESPKGDSDLEILIRAYIEDERLMEGV